jgi:hypothetical protein
MVYREDFGGSTVHPDSQARYDTLKNWDIDQPGAIKQTENLGAAKNMELHYGNLETAISPSQPIPKTSPTLPPHHNNAIPPVPHNAPIRFGVKNSPSFHSQRLLPLMRKSPDTAGTIAGDSMLC